MHMAFFDTPTHSSYLCHHCMLILTCMASLPHSQTPGKLPNIYHPLHALQNTSHAPQVSFLIDVTHPHSFPTHATSLVYIRTLFPNTHDTSHAFPCIILGPQPCTLPASLLPSPDSSHIPALCLQLPTGFLTDVLHVSFPEAK